MDPQAMQSLRVGYEASAEQFDPRSLLGMKVRSNCVGWYRRQEGGRG